MCRFLSFSLKYRGGKGIEATGDAKSLGYGSVLRQPCSHLTWLRSHSGVRHHRSLFAHLTAPLNICRRTKPATSILDSERNPILCSCKVPRWLCQVRPYPLRFACFVLTTVFIRRLDHKVLMLYYIHLTPGRGKMQMSLVLFCG